MQDCTTDQVHPTVAKPYTEVIVKQAAVLWSSLVRCLFVSCHYVLLSQGLP